jgi:hypothetical protein
MARWQPAKQDVLAALADEILQNYSSGKIAIDGDATSGREAFAGELEEALAAKGKAGDFEVVAGEELQRPPLAGQWKFAVWLEGSGEDSDAAREYLRQVSPRGKASAIIDNRDPEHPRRQFADSC